MIVFRDQIVHTACGCPCKKNDKPQKSFKTGSFETAFVLYENDSGSL